MADIVSKKRRSKMMSGIKTKGTFAEQKVCEALSAAGIPFELDSVIEKKRPDIVVEQFNTIILVHGCFWHVHHCHRFKWPDQNAEYWSKHLGDNIGRDQRNLVAYKNGDWRVLTVWECSLVGRKKLQLQTLIAQIRDFLGGDKLEGVIG